MAKGLIISRLAYLNIDKIVEFNNNRNKSETYKRTLFEVPSTHLKSSYWN